MKYLFDFTAFYYNTPVFYKIYKIGDNEYFAEPTDPNMRKFTLRKKFGYWVSEGGYTERHAVQIGETIDKFETEHNDI